MGLWLLPEPLVLASKSPSRRLLLQNAGIPIEIIPAEIDERDVDTRAGLSPAGTAVRLAEEKAKSVAASQPGRLVLGADQTLALGSRRFSKPADCDAAREQLRVLRGRTHELHSGFALVRDQVVLCSGVDSARLTMREFGDPFLEDYLVAAGTLVTESVGGYQLEGIGVHLFERIIGDHFTILGLPLFAVLAAFRRSGFVA
jgi:nucleoside triphosphate pyrophosphatase